MKKKLFNVTVGGYYLVSLILGAAIALTIGTVTCNAWLSRSDQIWRMRDAIEERYPLGSELSPYDSYEYKKIDEADEALNDMWPYLPMANLYDMMYDVEAKRDNGAICMAVSVLVSVILSVMIMEGKAVNRAWRQKMLQAIGIGMLIVLLSLTWRYAWLRSYGEMSTLTVLVPVVLMIVPLVMLKKTRVRKETRTVVAEAPATKTPTENN